jgi:hypothetical protein
MAVTAIALALIIPALVTVTSITSSSSSSSNANAEARNALQQLSTDISSANANNVCFPSSAQTAVSDSCPTGGSTNGNTMRILTNVFNTCQYIQWTVDSTTNALTQQSWPSSWTNASGTPAVTTLATPVVNSTSTPLFALATSAVSGSPSTTTSLVNVQIYLEGSTGTAQAAPSYSKPNTQYVFLQTSVPLLTSTQPSGSC